MHLYGPDDLIRNLAQEIATVGAKEYACNFIKIDEGDILDDKLPRVRGNQTRKVKKRN